MSGEVRPLAKQWFWVMRAATWLQQPKNLPHTLLQSLQAFNWMTCVPVLFQSLLYISFENRFSLWCKPYADIFIAFLLNGTMAIFSANTLCLISTMIFSQGLTQNMHRVPLEGIFYCIFFILVLLSCDLRFREIYAFSKKYLVKLFSYYAN